jgi:hypothetical protein
MIKFLRQYPWGEAALWLLFLVFGMGGALASEADQLTFGGLCALAAIGVRATRRPADEA